MKKIISVILIGIMVLTSTVFADGTTNFKDVEQKDWFYNSMINMMDLGIINGYKDNTFRPANSLKLEHFIKMLVCATCEEKDIEEQLKDDMWYQKYINTALKLNYIDEEMIKNIGKEINRKQMAKIVYKYLLEKEKYKDLDKNKLTKIYNNFTDITVEEKEILNVCNTGILTGYPDNTYKAERKLKRCESISVIDKIINKEKRTPVKPIDEKLVALEGPDKFGEPDLVALTKLGTNNPRCTFEWLNEVATTGDGWGVENILDTAKGLMNIVSNTDYNTIKEEKTKLDFIKYIHLGIEYRGVKYYHLNNGRYTKETDDGSCIWFDDLFMPKYVQDVKDNHIQLEGKFYADKTTLLTNYCAPTCRGILRFKINSADDLDLVKDIMFLYSTKQQKLDMLFSKARKKPLDNSCYMSYEDMKFELNTWYEIGIDIVLQRPLVKETSILNNFEHNVICFRDIYPLYIKELGE